MARFDCQSRLGRPSIGERKRRRVDLAAKSLRPLRLEDRAIIEAALGKRGIAPSEYCFANLWLFREKHQYRICELPVLHIRGVTYDGSHHAIPLVEVGPYELDALAASGVQCIYPLDARPEALGGWTAGWVDADSDYWFDGPAIGRMEFAKPKRAQVLQFNQCDPVFEDWSSETVSDSRKVLDGWLADVGRSAAATDIAECREAIAMADDLGLNGGLVRTGEGEPVAFMLASVRPDGVCVIHFAKGRRKFDGCYPWMFAQFALRSESRLLNFEQDLGSPGLAQSKRAYRPIEIRRKWRLISPE